MAATASCATTRPSGTIATRVNRIFEGTNEINRLLIPGMLIKRAVKGTLPLIPAARKLQDDLLSGPGRREGHGDGPWEDQKRAVEAFKKVALMMLGLAMQRYGEAIADEQEVLLSIADIVIAAACAESSLLRAMAAPGKKASYHADAASVFINDAASRVRNIGQAGARGRGGRRYTSHLSGRAQAGAQGDADRHHYAMPPAGG